MIIHAYLSAVQINDEVHGKRQNQPRCEMIEWIPSSSQHEISLKLYLIL